ncbi:MAG: sugar nucleotide-binding protein [Anaerolineae bacterium]|nr:sugar nucleotide-binding protein [Anaerolineae bacterium]
MSNIRTLLITGGSGYLGRRLARQAAAEWQVVASYFSHPDLPAGCQAFPLDVRDGPAVARLMADVHPTVVIHTAYGMGSPKAMQPVIVEGTRHVAVAAAAMGARLVAMSTDVIFDGEHGPYSEADPPNPVTPYGRAKAEAECTIAGLCPKAAIVRTSLIYGFDPPDPRTRWVVDSLRNGQPITLFTDELRCPVWVEQLAAALLELAAQEEEVSGIWHLAGAQALSRYEFGVRLARAYGLDPAGITSGQSRDSGLVRPRDCRLEIGRAQARLRSPLWGVDEVLDWTQTNADS